MHCKQWPKLIVKSSLVIHCYLKYEAVAYTYIIRHYMTSKIYDREQWLRLCIELTSRSCSARASDDKLSGGGRSLSSDCSSLTMTSVPWTDCSPLTVTFVPWTDCSSFTVTSVSSFTVIWPSTCSRGPQNTYSMIIMAFRVVLEVNNVAGVRREVSCRGSKYRTGVPIVR